MHDSHVVSMHRYMVLGCCALRRQDSVLYISTIRQKMVMHFDENCAVLLVSLSLVRTNCCMSSTLCNQLILASHVFASQVQADLFWENLNIKADRPVCTTSTT